MTATTSQQTTSDTATAQNGGLGRKMKSRHLVMMSLGSAIGTGLFVGTGAAIAAAGPAVLLSFVVASTLVILVMRMLGEMAAANPNSGAFSVYAEKAMGRTAGSTVGWLWWIQLVVVVAAEATASAAILHTMWPVLPQWALALVFIAGFTAINLFGVSKFGEMEFWFAVLKIAAIVVFLAIGTALILGLLPTANSPGFSNLVGHGGFMPNGFSGIAAGLLVVIFAFGGTEIVTVAAAETENPERNVGKAIRTVVWRILVFYIGSVLIMITVLPWNSEELGASPFVAVLTFAGLPGMQTAMGVVIAIALLSALNANLYGASRMIFSLSQRGRAPAGLSKLSARKVPQGAVLASVGFGFITVVLNYLWPETVLRLLLNAVGSTILVIWGAAIVSQIILRRRADRDPDVKLPLKMWAFPYLSYAALAILAAIVTLAFFDPAARNQLLATSALTVGIAVWCLLRDRRKARREAAVSGAAVERNQYESR